MYRAGARRMRGLAMGTILLAVVLIAATAIAITQSARSVNASSDTESNRAMASIVLNQASYIQRGVDEYHQQGIETCELNFTLTWPANKMYNIFDPAYTDVPLQNAPATALNDPSQKWATRWTECWGTIYEAGIGTATFSYRSGYYGVILPDLKLGVCQQINKMLYGSTVISTSTASFTTWTATTSPGALTTVSPGNSQQPAACFRTSDGVYIFYSLVDLHQPGDPPT